MFQRITNKLSQSSILTKINMVVVERNYLEMKPLLKLANNVGIDKIGFSPLLETSSNTSHTLPNIDNLWNEFREVLKFYHQKDFDTDIIQSPIPVAGGNSDLRKYSGQNELDYVCPAGTTSIEINSRGEVYPCPYLHYPRFSGGNINSENIVEIWEKISGQNFVKKELSITVPVCHVSFIALVMGRAQPKHTTKQAP